MSSKSASVSFWVLNNRYHDSVIWSELYILFNIIGFLLAAEHRLHIGPVIQFGDFLQVDLAIGHIVARIVLDHGLVGLVELLDGLAVELVLQLFLCL